MNTKEVLKAIDDALGRLSDQLGRCSRSAKLYICGAHNPLAIR